MPKSLFLNTGDDGPDPVLEEAALIESWIDGGAPSPADMWARLEDTAPEPPLTVAQAAHRENVSEKTIRRRLPALADMEPAGAYRIGRVWRIVPAALDALKEAPNPVAPSPSRRRKTKPTTGNTDERW